MSKAATASKTEEIAAAGDTATPAATVKVLTLDQRIARALGTPNEFTSFLNLISEVDEALDHADQRARGARTRALDPRTTDVAAARKEADDSEFETHRLRNGLQALQELQRAAVERAQTERLNADRARVRVNRDKLAADLKSLYPGLAKQLVKLFQEIETADRECLRVGIPSVECQARSISHLMANDVTLLEAVRLPALVIGGHGSVEVWPPKKLPMSLRLTGAPVI
jgi:hypothetical protein